MRVYSKSDIPTLKTLMVEAGFRFKGEPGVMTTKEMAEVIGVSETHLRWLEKKGVEPNADRDHANRRKWRKKDVRKLKSRLGRTWQT